MSLMQQYADCYGIPMQEVTSWVNAYVKGDVPDNLKPHLENTKEERIQSIKDYIQMRVYDSLTYQVKGDILNLRIANAVPKKVDLCPF